LSHTIASRLAAVLLCLFAAVPAGAAPPETGRFVTVRGKRLWVEDVGPRDAPVLLYIHGGPGAGSYDFMKLQGERLSRRMRVIAYDQRGVLRSDAVAADEPFGVGELVADVEALRVALGVRSWSVLGHSFGGIVALRYALEHPDPVEGIVFECPTFDLGSSSRALLRAAADELDVAGNPKRAAELRTVAERGTASEAFGTFGAAMGDLGDRRDNLYVHGPDKKFFDRIVAGSGLAPELWQKTAGPFGEKLFADPALHEDLRPRLGELRPPALLLVGKFDAVCPPEQVRAFRDRVPRGRVEVFERSAHFPRFEEPDRYADLVVAFVRSARPR
jgi:proline iminopeptidase